MSLRSKLRPEEQIQSTSIVLEELTVTDGYLVGSNQGNGFTLEDDINYLRTALKNLKGVDAEEIEEEQLHFSSDHSAVKIVSDGYGNSKGLPTISTVQAESINHALWLIQDKIGSGEGGPKIGVAEDNDYTDGLFVDFTTDTPIGTAVDRFNEVLKALSPPPAGNLSAISFTTSAGVVGKLSFGTSNLVSGYSNVGTAAGGSAVDLNGTYTSTGSLKGIYASGVSLSGVVAGGASAHGYAYPANSFGDGNQGTLKLELNGVVVYTVDLATFASGNSLNAQGSGFNLSAATSVAFQDGTPLSLFKYRTGNWTVHGSSQRNGWNYVRVIHEVGVSQRTTNYFEWIVDAETTATSFSSPSLYDLVLSGSKWISGVRYYTGGSAKYDITIDNLHRNTYSSSSSAISHPTTTNCDVASAALGLISDESDSEVITAKPVTVNPDTGSRILGGDLGVSTSVLRTVQATQTSSTTLGGWRILLDNSVNGANNSVEDFNLESFRLPSNLSLTSTSYASGGGNGPAVWNSQTSLVSGTAGYDGLLVYNGALRYPLQGFDSGDFRNVDDGNLNGPTIPGGYAGNPNYSAASGERAYLRYFYDAQARQNFRFTVSATGTTFVAASNKGSLTGNNVVMELLAPNTTVNGSGVVEWKDCVTPYTVDSAIGCYAASYGSTIPTSWGMSIGTKSTAVSGYAIVIRITAPASWTGSIDNISVTFL